MAGSEPPRRVLVTGAGGNLGRKLMAVLLSRHWCETVVAVDRDPPTVAGAGHRLVPVAADLADSHDPRWRDAMTGCEAVVHLAARNPAPSSPWSDACASFDITANVVLRALEADVRRLVFASSNHVMGRYKDPPLADGIKPGALSTAMPPGPGTRWHNGREPVDATAYAASKLRRAALRRRRRSFGRSPHDRLGAHRLVPARRQPRGDDQRGRLLPRGAVPPSGLDRERDLRWFRGMWLSNRDFGAVMERALLADASGWPSPGIVVNCMSRNRGMAWDVKAARALIDYQPQDDIWDHLDAEEAALYRAETDPS